MAVTKVRDFTMEDFHKQVVIARTQLGELGYTDVLKLNCYTLEFNTTRVKSLGRCTRISENNYKITLNKTYADTEDIQKINNTIMHELCHSIKDGMKHTGAWKVAVQKVNETYGYSISRTTKVSENYAEVIEGKRMQKKYRISCTCGQEWLYARETKVIRGIKNGTLMGSCPICKGTSLTVGRI